MKTHDLHPAPGSVTRKTRVGRGIAAGKGKTAGRGTKGQRSRAGASIPAWFEGGQTPLHQRIPKLRGFKNPFKIEFEVVNIGDIARLAELGELEAGDMPGAKGAKKGAAPITVNQEILRAAGLVRRLDKPMKVLGNGEISAALFVVADAFSSSAKAKIEAAGGTVSVLEVPTSPIEALGIIAPADAAATAGAASTAAAPADETAPETEASVQDSDAPSEEPDTAPAPKRGRSKAAAAEPDATEDTDAAPAAEATAPKAKAKGKGRAAAEPEAAIDAAADAEPDAPAE